MAQVIIIAQDMPDGNVDVRMHSEPVVAPGQTEFTDAQKMGAVALNAIHGALKDTGPKIIIAGADEIH